MKIKRSPETLRSLRQVLANPTLMGSKARAASEDEVYEYGEALMEELAAAAPAIAEAGRRAGESFGKAARAFADLGRTVSQA